MEAWWGGSRLAESIDRLKLAPDGDPAEQEVHPPDPDAPPQDEVASDALEDDDASKSDDPRELRFELRRVQRKLKEADLQATRLKKMAAHEAIERTRLALAHKESTDRVERLEREHGELKREHRDVSRDLERWREAAQAAKVQMEILRERRRKERDEAQQFGLNSVIQEMLPVFDHLELAITHASSDPGTILAGVQMVMHQLEQTLDRLTVERVEAELGQPFLPERHEAVLHVADTTLPHGAIVELLRPGYMLNGRLLRAARVSVASGPEEVAPPPAADAPPPGPGAEALDSENVTDDPTPYLKPIPLPLEDTGEVVFDPIPDPDEEKGGEPAG
jgi:molecular chaperone GrpE